MKRLPYIALLSAMVVLVFAAIAVAQVAQDRPDLSSSDQVPSPAPSEQATPGEQTTPGERATPSEQATPTQNETVVSIRGNTFDPARINVAGGTYVKWVNEDAVPHTVTADNGLFDQEIPPGYSYSVWLDGSGTVPYHCKIHPEMKGSITVGGANSQGGGATPAGPAATRVPPQTGGEPSQTPTEDSTQPGGEPAQMQSSY